MHPSQRFVALLESKLLMPGEVIAELRRQVSESKAKVPAELLARLLVENGHLTKYQASSLIAELNSALGGTTDSADDLAFAPARGRVAEALLEDDSGRPLAGASKADFGSATDVRNRPPNIRSTKSSRRTPVEPAESSPATSSDAVDANEFSNRTSARASLMPAERVASTRLKDAKANPWDSFRILGVGFSLALVCVAGFFLVRWLVRGNAEDAMKFADNAYQQRSYEDAANAYANFAANWPTHELASYANVRNVLATLRKDVEAASNPLVGLKTAEALLPTLLGQSALPDQQSDLAGVLVSLSEKFITKIDATAVNDERKSIMADMDKLMSIIGDPQFVGANQRTQLAPTLQRVEESRSRLRREIARDDELAAALVAIDKHLDDKQVIAAYETRAKLIDRYPLLEANQEVIQRVLRASDIQRDLVKESESSIQVEDSPPEDQLAKAYLLSHRSGRPADSMQGTVIYYQVKDTVVAVDGQSGQVRWRKWVGQGLDSHPIRLDDSLESDVLVTQPELGAFLRLDGRTGATKWAVNIGELINPPAVDGEDVFLSTRSGNVVNLDAVSGQVKWAKQLPQPANVGPGIAVDGNLVYQPASHSNVYSLDRRDGACRQVTYTGHREGALGVGPEITMEHLVLIENINAASARIKAFEITAEGLKQPLTPIAVDGNVVTPPSVDGRQILVQSNLGHSIVLDIEPSSAKEKVTVTARVPRNVDTPHTYWPAFQRNQVWLAENRLARFDLVVTQGKLNRRWIQHDGDEFVGPLQLFEENLVHARRPRGNQGVKISVAKAEDGVSIWETDLGVPVVILNQTANERFDVVANNGSYFALTEQMIRDRANANPGEGKPLKRFLSPVWLSPDRAVLLNMAGQGDMSGPAEFALYSAQDNNPLKILTLPLGAASPSCEGVAAGNHVVVGLDNGQLIMFDPNTGVLAGGAFQAVPMKPGQKVIWNRPAFLPQPQPTLIAASDVGKLVRLSVGESLRALSEERLEDPINGGLVPLGDNVAAVQTTNSGSDVMTVFDASNLKPIKKLPLNGQLLAGPFRTSNGLVVQTTTELTSLDESGAPMWSIAFRNSPLAGPPSAVDGKYAIATLDGSIWIVDAVSGQVSGSVNLRQRLSTAPVVRGNRVLVGTDDGVVLVLPLPTEHSLAGKESA